MSLVFNMVGGGSGGGSGPSASDAILIVTVPTGSTVTATKGGVTLTPTMWVSEADPTQDIAIFVISPSLFDSVNPWTVTATNGVDTDSATVVIDDNKEYEVVINYIPYFFRSGFGKIVEFSEAKQQNATISFTTDNIGISNTDPSGDYTICKIYTTAAVDITNFASIVFDATVTESGLTSDYMFGFYVSKTLNSASVTGTKPSSYIARIEPSVSARRLYTLNVSGRAGNAYIGTWGGGKVTIYNIYAVKS